MAMASVATFHWLLQGFDVSGLQEKISANFFGVTERGFQKASLSPRSHGPSAPTTRQGLSN